MGHIEESHGERDFIPNFQDRVDASLLIGGIATVALGESVIVRLVGGAAAAIGGGRVLFNMIRGDAPKDGYR